jgi:hypothetical protein
MNLQKMKVYENGTFGLVAGRALKTDPGRPTAETPSPSKAVASRAFLAMM